MPSQHWGVDGLPCPRRGGSQGPTSMNPAQPPLARLVLALRTPLSCSRGARLGETPDTSPSGFLLFPHPRWGSWGLPLPAGRGSEQERQTLDLGQWPKHPPPWAGVPRESEMETHTLLFPPAGPLFAGGVPDVCL